MDRQDILRGAYDPPGSGRELAKVLALVGGAFVFGAAIVGAGIATGLALDARDLPAAERRALCDDAAAQLLRAGTVAKVERERFVLRELRCRLGRSLRDLRPALGAPVAA